MLKANMQAGDEIKQMQKNLVKQLLFAVSSAALLLTAAILNPKIECIDIKRADTNPKSVEVNCNVQETEWLWTIPDAIVFDDNLTKTGTVSINPENNIPIILKQGTVINISIQASNDGFKLISSNNANSIIPYTVSKSGTLLNSNDVVLTYTAGESLTSGVSQELVFTTTGTDIKKALVSGPHSDAITFTVNVQKPAIATTFSDGTELTWDELKLAENGTKYGYNASAITDTSIGSSAFSGCTSLTAINISNRITSIEDSALTGCTSLTDIYFTGTKEQWNAITFGTNWNYGTDNYTIHCTDGDIAKS